MIEGLKPYPSYKDSGMSWLGQVPEHWHVKPAFALYQPRQVKNLGMRENTVLSLSYGKIVVKPEEKLHGLVPESFETYQIVDPGNIIVRTTDLQNDQKSLRIGLSGHRGIITSAYMCLETREPNSREYGYQVLNAYDLLKIIYGFGSGLRQNLDFSHIKRMPVPVPPKAEQDLIIRFLAHAEGRIGRHVRAKQRLIKLLEEQKQSIIHRAVTRGLDPNVRLKPSGIEWLGEVPESFQVAPFKRFVAFQEGPGIMAADFRSEGVPLIRISCLAGSVATLNGCNFLAPTMVKLRWDHFRIHEGDYLLSASGSLGNVARATALVEGAIPYTGIIRLWPIDPNLVEMEYVRYFMRSEIFSAQIGFMKSGVGIEHFGPKHLNRMVLMLPDIRNQRRILSWIEHEIALVEPMIDRIKDEIALLREYRTRLIADVVTGKLDVREAAARLPDAISTSPDDTSEEVVDDDTADGALEMEEEAA